MSRKPGLEGPSRLDMLKVWLLDPRSRIALRRRLAGFRVTRRSLLAAGMAVWLLYAALVWQFGGRRLEGCNSLACRVLLGGLPFGQGEAAPPTAAAGSAGPTPTPTTGNAARTPGSAPATTAGTSTTTATTLVVGAVAPSSTGAPPPTAGEPTSTTATTVPGSTTTTTAETTTTLPKQKCKPKKHPDCEPKKHRKPRHRWSMWPMGVPGRRR